MGIFQLKKNNEEQVVTQTTILQGGTQFVGDIKSDCSIRIESIVHGNIVCVDRVVIGEKAFVKGTIEATNMEIYGEVEGELSAESISLKTGCKVRGDINCTDLFSEQGAFFSGICETIKQQKQAEGLIISAEESTANYQSVHEHTEIVSTV